MDDPRVNHRILKLLHPAEARYQLAHIDESRVADILSAQVICISIATVAVTLRFASRWLQRTRFGADDWTVLAALIIQGGAIASILLAVMRYGGGRHAILLIHPVAFAKSVLAAEALYPPAIGLVKISTCFLFARIFPQSRFRWFLASLALFVAIYSTIQTLLSIFQCQPIDAAWHVTSPKKCIKINSLWEIMGGMNVLTDLALLIAPLPQLWALQIPRQTKAQLVGLFCVGGFITIVSIYRIPKIHGLSIVDPSWSDADTSIWSTVEVCVAIACGCAITYKPLINRIFAGATSAIRSTSRMKNRSYDSAAWHEPTSELQKLDVAYLPQIRHSDHLDQTHVRESEESLAAIGVMPIKKRVDVDVYVK